MTHTISISTSYGEVLACEQVAEPDFAAALRRFYGRAVERTNTVVELDGMLHSRNAFLDFVRYFNESAADRRQS